MYLWDVSRTRCSCLWTRRATILKKRLIRLTKAIRTIIDTAYARTRELLQTTLTNYHLLAQELIEKKHYLQKRYTHYWAWNRIPNKPK